MCLYTLRAFIQIYRDNDRLHEVDIFSTSSSSFIVQCCCWLCVATNRNRQTVAIDGHYLRRYLIIN